MQPEAAGRFAYEGLERILHEKARLGIMTSLMTQHEGLVFAELKELCALTDGNLNRHIQVLHEAGLVAVLKGTRAGRPQTRYRLTVAGRRRFVAYLSELERVIQDAQAATAQASRRRASDLPGELAPA